MFIKYENVRELVKASAWCHDNYDNYKSSIATIDNENCGNSLDECIAVIAAHVLSTNPTNYTLNKANKYAGLLKTRFIIELDNLLKFNKKMHLKKTFSNDIEELGKIYANELEEKNA